MPWSYGILILASTRPYWNSNRPTVFNRPEVYFPDSESIARITRLRLPSRKTLAGSRVYSSSSWLPHPLAPVSYSHFGERIRRAGYGQDVDAIDRRKGACEGRRRISGADQDYVYGAIVESTGPHCATGSDGHHRFSYAWLNVISIGTGIHNDLVVLGRR